MSKSIKFSLVSVAVVGIFLLLVEHRPHLFGILPYALLLACPLLHLFHEHGETHDKKDEHQH